MDAHEKHTPTWTLSDRMWKARKDAGLSPAQIADLIGISRKSVWTYETGTTKPLRPILKAWAEVTGTYIEWLEHGEQPFQGGIGRSDVTHELVRPRCVTHGLRAVA